MKKLIAMIALLSMIFSSFPALCDEPTEAWVLCQPDSYINIRRRPDKGSRVTGQLYSGDNIWLDGKEAYGYLHCVNCTTEEGEGWVSKGFVVHSEPREDGNEYHVKANGRVAARRSVDGYRRCWLRDNDILVVYMISEEWCLTNKGFVQTRFIDVSCPLNIETPDPAFMTWEE